MITKQEISEAGYTRGENIASWQDLPEIGAEIKPFQIPDFTGVIEDVEDAEEVFLSVCYEAEMSNRDFTPFEFTCKELNDMKKSYDVWEVFNAGINKGIQDNWESRKEYYEGE